MGVYFKDVESSFDWRPVVEGLAVAGLAGLAGDRAAAFTAIRCATDADADSLGVEARHAADLAAFRAGLDRG